MINKNILKIRKDLDKLDNLLLDVIKKRTELVDLVIKNKKFKKDIVDKKRISVILKNISKVGQNDRVFRIRYQLLFLSLLSIFLIFLNISNVSFSHFQVKIFDKQISKKLKYRFILFYVFVDLTLI